MIYAFKNLRTVASKRLLIQTYKALCECIIGYCICAWGGAAKTHMIVLERAQRAVLKVMLYLPKLHPTDALYKEDTKVLSVRKMFIHQTIRRYHQLTDPHPKANTRRQPQQAVPRTRTAFADRHFNIQAPRLYNLLNKNTNTRILNRIKIKSAVVDWLRGFDYDSTERLVCPLS
ncbi:hypothetical protein JYU34_010842 [Plutella xylostella]|uniref:Uncharacterized protein n=1 Tax=Plutella xylostella TaxID=51655 RepID=A0ABQ7QFD4_PLUXY|nr:hypothetical protein JYU34_010842 [Plutella xylostella]